MLDLLLALALHLSTEDLREGLRVDGDLLLKVGLSAELLLKFCREEMDDFLFTNGYIASLP